MAHSLRAASLALLTTLLTIVPHAAAAAQEPASRRPVGRSDTLDAHLLRFRAEVALAVATPLVRDANGTRVVTGASPLVGAAVSRELSSGTTLAAGVRIARLSLGLRDEAGASWDAGTAWHMDAVAAAERNVGRCHVPDAAGCTAARAGASVVFLGGPRDVVPFRQSGSRWGVGGEAGAAVRVVTAWPLYATVGGHAYRLFGVSSAVAGPVRAGVVARALVGIRYGR